MFNNEENKDNATVTTASAASYYIYITPRIGKVLYVHYFSFPGRQMG